MVSERVLRRTVKLKRDLMIGDWRKLCNEELHTLYSSSYIIRIISTKKYFVSACCFWAQ
jgi:hypothetical protein